ncbi:uncharacterized protein LOC129609930 [Condylostylus longicornis]|uniref:uncharacterized protein LOC129609930 n=1 Tax=Condylostylus longicornis TaxID=2530218 RepID=UPI00244E3D08|nr:uncharacterized protein LOC129609930 [Condylostylus longicornis]XP_055378195.1 uncharacterized protein LOC129609930 [Condylostylus longicornis]
MASLPPTFVKGFHDEQAVQKMEYRDFGKTDMKVSRLAIGGATLSSLFGEINKTTAIETVRLAIKNGINYVDTAPFYGEGESEQLLGEALKVIPRQSYYLATKIGRYSRDFSRMFDYSGKKTRESVEKSLKLLGVDYIDVIQIHDIEFEEPIDLILKETLPTLETLRKEGKIRYIGVSAYPIGILKECISKAGPGHFDTVLSYSRYTLIDETLCDFIPFFKEQNLAIINAAVHGIGILSNNGPQPWHPASEKLKNQCKKAAEICKQNGVELGKLAMYYAAQYQDTDICLVGMATPELLKINLDAVLNGLNEKETQILKLIKKEIFIQGNQHWEGVEIKAYKEWKSKNKA